MRPKKQEKKVGDVHSERRLKELHQMLEKVAKEHAVEENNRRATVSKKKKADSVMDTRIDAVASRRAPALAVTITY